MRRTSLAVAPICSSPPLRSEQASLKKGAGRRRWRGRLQLLSPIALVWLSGCSTDANDLPTKGNPSGGSGGGPGGLPAVTPECEGAHPGRAPIRRLTRFEYNNAVAALFGDMSRPGDAFPPETIGRIGNLFGNDSALLSVSSNLAAQWGSVAQGVAERATATPEALAKLAPCASSPTADEACARTVVDSIASRAYHRALAPAEVDKLAALATTARGTGTFASGIAAVIEGVLQAPEFLYRVEHGAPAADRPDLRRPTADEMAARLSFLFWGSIPDEPLRAAARNGELATAAGVEAQARRLVESPQARPVVRFFFDNLLPISGLTNLARDSERFPIYSQTFAAALREETQQFLEHEIFDAGGAGTWAAALTAPYTYVNEQLATFYGMVGVTGPEFRKVAWPDATKRLGLLTQAGVMTGTIVTNEDNPVLRGSFIVNKLMCKNIPLPTDPAILALVTVPEGVTGTTARERFSQHSVQPLCAACHAAIDPVGFPLENYDPIGQWRDQDGGETIDASGSVPGYEGTVNGPVELIQKLAGTEEIRTCFASHWLQFAYGKTLDASDACTQASINEAFKKTGGNVKQLLVDLTQTDSFLYLPAKD